MEEPRITVDDLTDRELSMFLTSPIWRCIRADLEERLEFTKNLLSMAPIEDTWGEDESKRPVLMHSGVRRLQGAVKELEFVLMLPESYIEEIKSNREEKQNATT